MDAPAPVRPVGVSGFTLCLLHLSTSTARRHLKPDRRGSLISDQTTSRRLNTRRSINAMAGMQQFVRGNRDARAGSPQNRPSSSSTNRQNIGANAKVLMKPHVSRGQALPTHNESVVHRQTSSFPQQQAQPRSGTGPRDAWETDTGSIDSTANQSVFRVKDESNVSQQEMKLEDHEAGDDEDASDEDQVTEDERPWPPDFIEYFAQNNMADASREDQEAFLGETQPHLFRTIDGDSYPTTTDGNPTEWDEQHNPRYEDPGSLAPSPKRLSREDLDPSSLHQHSLQPNTASGHANAAMPQGNKIWRQSAQLREKQRTDDAFHGREQPYQPHATAYPSASQPPRNSQATVQQHNATLPAMQAPPEVTVQEVRSFLPQASSGLPPGPKHHQNPIPNIILPNPASKGRAKVVPTLQPHNEPVPSEEPVVVPNCDYDEDVLFDMKYEQLKDESFDTNPRATPPVLPEELRSRSLTERLEYAQNLDPANQSEFFGALPTEEWEDAGDWFLDQFDAIIKKTREARQKKRTAAKSFEKEIEERHQHVAKKQRLVASAMSKMKAQGEGLVPRSSRPSKSPRPRRG